MTPKLHNTNHWAADLIAGLTAGIANIPDAMAYSDQTERDYQLLVEAVDSGQVVAAKGI